MYIYKDWGKNTKNKNEIKKESEVKTDD